MFYRNVAFRPEELGSRQGRAHFVSRKTCRASRNFACFKNSAPDAASRPRGMNEKRPNLGCIAPGIQQRVLSPRPMIAAIKSFAFAPTSAPGYHPFRT